MVYNNLIKRILSIVTVIVLTFQISVFGDKIESTMDYRFILDDEALGNIYLDFLEEISEIKSEINLQEADLDILEDLKDEKIVYIPTNNEVYNKYGYSDEYFNIQVINEIYDLNIIFDDSDYTPAEKEEMLKDKEKMVFTSEYLFTEVNIFENSKNYIRTMPYTRRNSYIVGKKDYDISKDVDRKIGISKQLSGYKINDIYLLDGEVAYYDNEEARQAIENGEIDYYICENYELPLVVYNSDLVYKDAEMYIANFKFTLATYHSIEKQNFFSVVNKIYRNEDITNYYLKYMEFISANKLNEVFQVHLTEKEREYISNNEEISLGFITTLTLMEDSVDVYNGLIFEYLYILSKLTGIDINYVSYNSTSYNDVIEDMYNNFIDIVPVVLNNNNDIELIKKQYTYLDFEVTDPFLKVNVEILRNSEVEQLVSYNRLNFSKVGILSRDYFLLQGFFKEVNFLEHDQLKLYDNPLEMVSGLEKGTIDYIIVLPGFSNYVLENTGKRFLRADDYIIEQSELEWSIAVNTDEENEELVSIINKVLPVIDKLHLRQYFLDNTIEYVDKLEKGIAFNQVILSIIFLTLLILLYLIILLVRARETNNQLDQDISFDNKTKLRNYRSFVNLDKSKFKDYIVTLIEVDSLDRFIEFYGTSLGEEVILEISKRISNLDIENEYTPFRIGQYKFVLVINHRKGYEFDEQELKNELSERLGKRYVFSSFNSSMNFKVTSIDNLIHKDTLVNNLNLLEIVSSNIKNVTGVKWLFLTKEDITKNYIDKQIEKLLIKLEPGTVLPFFQPLVSSKTGKVVGCEVLARLKNKTEILSAYQFIPLAKQKGVLGKIDEMLLEKVIEIREELLKENAIDEDFYFSVNASVQLLREFDVVYLRKLKGKYNLENFDFLQIEVLEEFMESNFLDTSIEAMRDNNLRVAIDDFSAGHSSLGRITTKYFDVVKIDRGIMPINFNEEHKLVLRFIIGLLKDMDYKIISEGVETQEHVDFLTEIGVDLFQGFYYSRALPRNDFVNYIKKVNG